MFLIKGPYCCGDQLFWSNDDGWVDMEGSPTVFADEEEDIINMPIEAVGIVRLGG